MNQQQPVYTHESQPVNAERKRPNFLLRRIFAGAAALSFVPVLYVGVKAGNQVYENAQTARFSQFHLSDKPNSKFFRINKDDVITYTIKESDVNPTQVVRDLGVIDIPRGVEMANGQLGGDKSMEIGEELLFPEYMINSYESNNIGQVGGETDIPGKTQQYPRTPHI